MGLPVPRSRESGLPRRHRHRHRRHDVEMLENTADKECTHCMNYEHTQHRQEVTVSSERQTESQSTNQAAGPGRAYVDVRVGLSDATRGARRLRGR